MPILREHDMREIAGQPVHHRHDLVATRHGERAARAEIVLHVDDQQQVPFRRSRHGATRFLRVTGRAIIGFTCRQTMEIGGKAYVRLVSRSEREGAQHHVRLFRRLVARCL
jgi:hypothetical protein